MKKNLISFYLKISIVILILLLSAAVNTGLTQKLIKTNNREIDLGYASIWGNGTKNILKASAENNLIIRTDSTSEVVDFYIDYDMKCEGLTDEGIITLTLTLDGKNISANFTQTPTIKSGALFLNNVEINRGDSLGFRIDVFYGNLLPLYYNETTAFGAAVVSKNTGLNSLIQKNYPYLYNFLQRIIM
jgi:hypothetical protein